MSTFNVRAGTKVPCIGNAPPHFTASALTLHQPEMHRSERKRIFVAIHRRFRVNRVVTRHDSAEHRAVARASQGRRVSSEGIISEYANPVLAVAEL